MTRQLSFQQLAAFRAVVLSGTTVAAARMLHTTQPTISRLLGQAQQASGLNLFVNDRGRLQLTREGKALFDAVQVHFQGMETVERTLEALRASGAGVFRVAATPSLAQGMLPPALKAFMGAHPRVHLSLHTLGSRDIEDGLRRGLFDVALTNSAPDPTEFEVTQIHDTDAVVVAPAGHRFEVLEAVGILDLKDEVIISLPAVDSLVVDVRTHFESQGLTWAPTLETIYSATICSLVAQGLGVSVINPYIAGIFKQSMCIRPFTPRLRVRTFTAVPRFTAVSELTGKFLEQLKRHRHVGKN